MAKASIRDRLAKLEDQRRFLDWFVRHSLNGQPEELDCGGRRQSSRGWHEPDKPRGLSPVL